MERQTVSIMKACEMVGVSRRTIYNWIAANKVEYLRTAGGSIRIFVDTLWREPDGTTRPTSPNGGGVDGLRLQGLGTGLAAQAGLTSDSTATSANCCTS